MFLGIAAQQRQRRAPGNAVSFEHGELLGRCLAVDLGLDVLLELPVGDRLHGGRRRQDARRSVAGQRPGPMYPRIFLRWTTWRSVVRLEEVWVASPRSGIGRMLANPDPNPGRRY